MSKNIRLIGLDLDGTTLNEKKEITPRVAAAIQKAIAAGIVVLPATGRALGGIPESFLRIPGVEYAVCSNGAKIYRLSDKKELLSNCFTTQTALSVLESCRQFDVAPAAFVDGVVCSSPIDGHKMRDLYEQDAIHYYLNSRKMVQDLENWIAGQEKPVEKFSLIFYSMAERRRAMEYFNTRSDCAVSSSMPGNLELNAAGVNKGLALLELGRLLAIEPRQVMAIGDSSNDREMLMAVGYAVAMANGDASVRDIADAVTASCEEDGVALAIESVIPQ